MKNIQTFFKSFFSNLKNKIKSMDNKQRIVASLWLGTFFILIIFVILAGALDKDLADSYANTLASIGFLFTLLLFSSLITTVIFANKKRKEEINNG